MGVSRRNWLTGIGLTLAAGQTGHGTAASRLADSDTLAERAARAESPLWKSWKYSLNTSTIRGQKLPLEQQVEIAAQAGYGGIEPWIGDIEDYVKRGKSLADMQKRCADLNLAVVSAIGFAPWIANDDAVRAKGLEQAKRDMDLVRQMGGTRIAAPPAGETENANLDLFAAAQRYHALCDVGQQIGVTPQVEVWGFSKALSRLGETVFVAVESGHPRACILPDVYHIYKGGSDFAGLKLLSGSAVQVMHINDYPGQPPRAEINDSHRVYPGDGVAPLGQIFQDLQTAGFAGWLSLELFNPEYWKQDALEVAKTGLAKSQAAVAAAFATG
ncbi:MAG: sugar phosphate isomerase/epimerase family protein [Pirellulales bacterium]|nr:sugar phosphate isomerase/epimerase family protein [Pirellulales bacterium]